MRGDGPLFKMFGKDIKSHATVWQVLNNRWCVAERVSGKVIESLTFHEYFYGNVVNIDTPRISKCIW